MKYEVLYRGSFAMIKAYLEAGEAMKAESGAMVAMDPNIDVEGKAEGGIMKGLKRMVAGESFFFQTLHAVRGPGEVLLSPATLGDVVSFDLDGSYALKVEKDGFLAGTAGIEVDATMQNLSKGLFSGEGFFVLKISGRGTVFLSSLGAVHAIDLAPGQQMIVDNQHLVAWPDSMNYTIEKASKGWISSFTSGEGLVCRFTGPGRILIQSRNPGAFGSWIRGFMPTA